MKKPASLFKGCDDTDTQEARDSNDNLTDTDKINRLEDEKADLLEKVVKMKEELIQTTRRSDQRALAIVANFDLTKRDEPLDTDDTRRLHDEVIADLGF